MADQELGIKMKTSSDVPEAMGKAKSATVSFSKQVEDIQKKFSTAFKDIFLGFTAPMVLLQGAISYISAAIEKAKQDAKDGLDLLAKGETVYASSEEKKMAAFFKQKREREEEMRLVSVGKAQIAAQFLDTEQGKKIAYKLAQERGQIIQDELDLLMFPRDVEFQKRALQAFLNSPEGKAYQPIFEGGSAEKGSNFKGPEGFSNVIGVGSNPVIEAMNAQLEEQRKQTGLLQNLVDRNPFVSEDFTKTPSK
jgi:hypothetical protein